MSTPHDPWSTGPTPSNDDSTTNAAAHDAPATDPSSEPAPGGAAPAEISADDRTMIRPSDGTYSRQSWTGTGDGTADPNATQVRPAQARPTQSHPTQSHPTQSHPTQPGGDAPSDSAQAPAGAGASAWNPPAAASGPTNPPSSGYGQSGFGQSGFGQPGYGQAGYGQGANPPSGYGQGANPPSGYGQGATPSSGYGRQGHQPPSESRSEYGQPAPGAAGYQGQPGYGPQNSGPQAYGQAGYAPPPGGYYTSPTTQKSSTKRPLIIGLCALLVLALATVGFVVLRPSSSPAFTFAGKKISNADAVLTSAQTTTATLVKSRHGASNSDTRCYFARSTTPAKGTKKSDIDANAFCGPVLFVDGDKTKTYLSYPLTQSGAKGSAVTLSAGATPASAEPQSAPADKTLGRPDKAAAKTSTLALPTPPPAAANVFSTTADITGQTLTPAPADAVIGSRNGGVDIASLGTITRYGHGDDARSAPTGQKLIAFKTKAGPDENGDDHFPFGTITVVANGQTHTVPKTAATVVVAVPTSATAADLVVNDAGVTQKISLLNGKPAATNIVVGRRRNREGPSESPKNITFTISDGGDTVTRTARVSLLASALRYWVRIGDNRHAASTGSALLYVNLEYSYTEPLKSPFTGSDSNGPYGFAPQLLTLHLPNGQIVAARNYATESDKLYLLFSVPPSFTLGRIVMSGTQPPNKNGVVLGLKGAPYFDVHIPAG